MTSAEAVSPRGRGSAVTAASVTSADTGPPLVIPGYGRSTLADLSTSLLASPGVPAEANPLDLAPADRACLLVIDGMGWELLREHPAAAPCPGERARSGQPLSAGFRAATVTSLSSLGAGRSP